MGPAAALSALQVALLIGAYDEVEWAAQELRDWLDAGGRRPPAFRVTANLGALRAQDPGAYRAVDALIRGHRLGIVAMGLA